jgi:hypothetical protein
MNWFYKNDWGELIYAPNYVLASNFELKIEDKDTYTYPVEGWVYFENQTQAEEYFKLWISDEKWIKIFKIKCIEKEAIEKRSVYLTTELLPDWDFKTAKLLKLEQEWEVIRAKYNTAIVELVTEYGETILSELI